jgi:hypothetical protein
MVDIERGDVRSAQQRLHLALKRCELLASPTILQCLLDACGALLIEQGQAHVGAQLIATANRLAADTGSQRDPTDDRFVQRALARAGQACIRRDLPDRGDELSFARLALERGTISQSQ